MSQSTSSSRTSSRRDLEGTRIVDMASAHGRSVIPNTGTNSTLHLIAATENVSMAEHTTSPVRFDPDEKDETYADDIYVNPPEPEDATVTLPG